jgi:putative salt-induced outer membrane protein YdiY
VFIKKSQATTAVAAAADDNNNNNNNTPKSVKTNCEGKVNISWNQQVQTDRIITNNKPDSIIRDN